MAVTIHPENSVVTHINVFATTPDRQQALVDSLLETVKVASEVPGWISASIHRSFDGRQVVNYVQFKDHDAAQRVTRHLLAGGYIRATPRLDGSRPASMKSPIRSRPGIKHRHSHDAAVFGSLWSGSITSSCGASLPFQRHSATQLPPGDMCEG